MLEARDLALVLVDADDLDAELGKTGAGDQPDIAGADHGNTHGNPLSGRPTCSFTL